MDLPDHSIGMESIAIPHNMNGSDGWMFERTYYRSDKPIDAAYAEIRMRNEPLVENSQVKGTSDTHPLLSPNDEWADFELMELRIASTLASQPEGSYVRNAFLNGILMEEESGINPYKFGVIAASDTHNAAGSFEEDNYWSKTGLMDINPVNRGSVPLPDSDPEDLQYADGASSFWGASGLAGVWAESNTRDAIFDSFRSKETFATSGPHIRVRFFGGHGLAESLEGAEDVISAAYANGVPMGGDLNGPTETSPSFYLWASKDPDTEPLQRLQIIKGWIEVVSAKRLLQMSRVPTGAKSILIQIDVRITAPVSILPLAPPHEIWVLVSLAQHGQTLILMRHKMLFTMCVFWRTQSVDGLLGTLSELGPLSIQICMRRSRIVPGRRQSGTTLNNV